MMPRKLFLTGAGVSTASGIPDYRSKGGIYDDSGVVERPEYLLSTDALNREPEKFMKENMYFPDAKPNHSPKDGGTNAPGPGTNHYTKCG
ncbi:NAD-dependent deacetylase [Weissella cibaria]|nr:NAD-dependent deacetylase [Weissella cibaria]